MQKKILGVSAIMLALFLLLALYFTVLQPKWSQIPKMDAFEVNENCPYLCWKGISPGKTTYTEARKILQTSWDVDQRSFWSRNKDMQAKWFTERTRMRYARAWIYSENDVVQSISFTTMGPFQLDDFVSFVGAPDSIKIELIEDFRYTIKYTVYFQKHCSSLTVRTGYPRGPHPEDYIGHLTLKDEFLCNPGFSDEDFYQPWLGYGHLEEYLPEYNWLDWSLLSMFTPEHRE